MGGNGSGALSAFDAATGAAVWAWKGDGPGYGLPVVAEIAGTRQVVTFTEGLLVGVDADSGRLLWKVPYTTDYAQNAVTPVVNGNVVIVSGLDHPVQALRVVASKGRGWTTETVWENPDVASVHEQSRPCGWAALRAVAPEEGAALLPRCGRGKDDLALRGTDRGATATMRAGATWSALFFFLDSLWGGVVALCAISIRKSSSSSR